MAASQSMMNVNDEFELLMRKLASVEPLGEEDEAMVGRIAAASFGERRRQEIALPRESDFDNTLAGIGPMYKDGMIALTARGWMEFPSKQLGAGSYGAVTLGMRVVDQVK